MANAKGSFSLKFSKTCTSDASSDKGIEFAEDTERNGDSTCHLYGNQIYFRVFCTPPDMKISIAATSGTLINYGEYTDEVTDDVTFDDTNEASAGKYIDSGLSIEYYGTDLGAVTKTGDRKLQAETSGVAIAAITYTTRYRLYSITIPTQTKDEWKVFIYAKEQSS
jgi:hypothetical protein